MSTISLVASEVATLIGGIVDYVPEFELQDFKAEKILIAPTGITYEDNSRGSEEKIVTLEVGIIKRIREGELPEMLDKVEDIIGDLQAGRYANGLGSCSKVTHSPAYDIQSMVTKQTFIAVLNVEIRIL